MKIQPNIFPKIGSQFKVGNCIYNIDSIEGTRINLSMGDVFNYWTDVQTYHDNIKRKFWTKML